MTREILFNVTSAISNDIVYNSDDPEHGTYATNGSPTPTLPANATTQAFYIQKTDWSAYGVTGSVTYQLPDNSLLVLSYNVPYTQVGSGSPDNDYYYAFIQSPDPNNPITPAYYVDSVQSNEPMMQDPPQSADSITVDVVIKSI